MVFKDNEKNANNVYVRATKALVDAMYHDGILVTNINYPVVPKGKDEIRVQLSALHTKADLDEFVEKAKAKAHELGML